MLGKILTRLFALFGFSLTCVACYGTMYDEYNPQFLVSGRVVDGDGKPIEGIEVSSNKWTMTDSEGRFRLGVSHTTIRIEDVDGEENGGEFEPRELNIQDRHSYGNYTTDLGDIELKRKEDKAEELE